MKVRLEVKGVCPNCRSSIKVDQAVMVPIIYQEIDCQCPNKICLRALVLILKSDEADVFPEFILKSDLAEYKKKLKPRHKEFINQTTALEM